MPRIESFDQYADDCSETVTPLLKDLRSFINETLPSATEGMQYGVPVFRNAHGVPVIYLFGSKDHVNFGFLRSAELSDPKRILKGSGKPSKHLEVYPGGPVDKATLAQFVEQCERITS